MEKNIKIAVTVFFISASFQLLANSSPKQQVDTTIYSYKTVILQGKKYSGYLNQNAFYLVNSKNEIILKHAGEYFTWDIKDFNRDGHKDIFLDKGGNTPERFALLIFVPTTNSYKVIKDFDKFPDAKQINGTKYYYSYHRSGCADMDWNSDLFYINNYRAIRLGNIQGLQCANSGKKDGIYIHKYKNGNRLVIKTLPIKTIEKYKALKWGFIKEYWENNYKKFL